MVAPAKLIITVSKSLLSMHWHKANQPLIDQDEYRLFIITIVKSLEEDIS